MKNIVLMGIVAQNFRDIVYYQYVNLPLEYATQVLDKNHSGLISIQQIAKDPVLIVVLSYIGDNIAYQHGLHFCQEVYPYRNQNKV